MPKTTLSQRFKVAFDESKFQSQAALAVAAGTSDVTVNNWLKDRVQSEQVKGDLLLKFCKALNVRAEWLLWGDGDMRHPSATIDPSQPVKLPLLTSALQLVGSTLLESELPMPPDKQAELVTLCYELLEEGMPEAKVLRFVRAAA